MKNLMLSRAVKRIQQLCSKYTADCVVRNQSDYKREKIFSLIFN